MTYKYLSLKYNKERNGKIIDISKAIADVGWLVSNIIWLEFWIWKTSGPFYSLLEVFVGELLDFGDKVQQWTRQNLLPTKFTLKREALEIEWFLLGEEGEQGSM